ncbi:uncharacterized protein [Hetaerina americana]|uniref:uncharacterized protein n=1 Tax=Hetaerina americana TaxID=62018 RepID=UPI003A7F213D
MSGIFKNFFRYIFGGAKNPELQSNAPSQVSCDFNNHETNWAEFWQENQESKIEVRDDETFGPKTNSIHDGHFRDPSSASNSMSPKNDEWDCDYNVFSESLNDAPDIGDLKEKYIDIFTEENKSLFTAHNDMDEKDDIKVPNLFSAEDKPDGGNSGRDIKEEQPILPDLSSGESSDDDTLKGEECNYEKELQKEETNEEASRGTLTQNLRINDNTQVSSTFLCMSDQNLPEGIVKPRIMTVIPMDKVNVIQSNGKYVVDCDDQGITSFLVMSKGPCSVPINTTPQVQNVESNSTIASRPRLESPAVTETGWPHKLPLSCKDMTLEEMYRRFTQCDSKTPSSKQNAGANRSPNTNIKKLMDVNLHSSLAYTPEANSLGTPPKSSVSLAGPSVPSPNASIRTLGCVSAASGNRGGRGLPSPRLTSVLKTAKKNAATTMTTTASQNVGVIKGRAITGIPKKASPLTSTRVHGGTSSKTCKSMNLHSRELECKNVQVKDEFATTKSSASQSEQVKSETISWPGTPHPGPAPKTSSNAGTADGQRGGVQAVSGKDVGNRRAVNSHSKKAAGSESRPTKKTSCLLGKRSKLANTTGEHAAPVKKKPMHGGNSTPGRCKRSSPRIQLSKVCVQGKRPTTAVVSYKV